MGRKPEAAGATGSAKRFFTDTGLEVPAVTAEQMRALDRIAMEETGPNVFQMMENAGRNVALLAIALLGDAWNTARVVVLAGSGGNGGGGICAARHLANRGVHVCLCVAEPGRVHAVPAFQRNLFRLTGAQEIEAASVGDQPVEFILDGLIGYGLRSAPRSSVAALIGWANGTGAPILALDVPSGVDATTGRTPGAFVRPRWTMTLALPKTGLRPERSGALLLADLGIPEGVYRRVGLPYSIPFGKGFWVPLNYR